LPERGSLSLKKLGPLTWATTRAEGLGEPPSDSLRRVRLAWARLPVLALISPTTDVFSNPTNHTKYSTHQK